MVVIPFVGVGLAMGAALRVAKGWGWRSPCEGCNSNGEGRGGSVIVASTAAPTAMVRVVASTTIAIVAGYGWGRSIVTCSWRSCGRCNGKERKLFLGGGKCRAKFGDAAQSGLVVGIVSHMQIG